MIRTTEHWIKSQYRQQIWRHFEILLRFEKLDAKKFWIEKVKYPTAPGRMRDCFVLMHGPEMVAMHFKHGKMESLKKLLEYFKAK